MDGKSLFIPKCGHSFFECQRTDFKTLGGHVTARVNVIGCWKN